MDWVAFAIGGFKLMCGVVIINAIAGGFTFLIAKNRGRNTQMLVFLAVIFLMGGLVYGLK